jgi:ClpP class serine protease
MNFPLAREIYGMTPFCVDSQTLPAMLSVLDDVRNGVKYTGENELKNSVSDLLSFDSDLKLITSPYDLETNETFEGVSLMKINGPILLNSGNSTIGMKAFSNEMLSIANDNRVKGFVLLMDSGGGSTAAVELMVDTIKEIQSNDKPVYVLIDKGGTLGSAAYGIASAAKKIYYQSDMSIVGSLGTMIQTEGVKANSEIEGVKYLRIYATKSTEKNGSFEQAFNNDNYDLIINELLDPINERFLSMLKENRSELTIDQLNGSVAFAMDSIGVYVDGKSTINEITKEILNNNTKINFNQSSMTRSELQSQHPDLLNEVFNAGVTAESERVQSWLAHFQTDSVLVMEGIESGNEIAPSQREKLLVKANKQEKLTDLKSENAKDFQTAESTIDSGDDSSEIKNAFNFKLK